MSKQLVAVGFAFAMATSSLLAQGPAGSAAIDAHLAAARAAAQQDFLGVYNRLCTPEGATKALIESKGGAPAAPATPRPAATRPPGPPDKSTWAIASGQGLRQPDVRRREGILVVGGDDTRGHHRHRHDLRILSR